jgi:hypothetical protein
MLIVNLYYSLQDHLLLKTSKQLTVCIFYQSIHETLSSCNTDRWLRGGAVVVTSGSADIEPLEQGCRMGGRKRLGSARLAGNRTSPALRLAPPRRRGTRRRRLCWPACKRKKGRERSLLLHLGGGWPKLWTAAIPIGGALRLPPAAKTCRPPSAGSGELKRYKP